MILDRKYFIIDRDECSVFISCMMLKKVFGNQLEVDVFNDHTSALFAILKSASENPETFHIVISGSSDQNGQSRNLINKLKDTKVVKNRKLWVYVMTDSVSLEDIRNSVANPHVISFVEKPLNRVKIQAMERSLIQKQTESDLQEALYSEEVIICRDPAP